MRESGNRAKQNQPPIPYQLDKGGMSEILHQLAQVPGAFPLMTPGNQIIIFEHVVMMHHSRGLACYDSVDPDEITYFEDVEVLKKHFFDMYHVFGNKK